MFKVKIYTIGKTKETWLQEALAEYEKRLSRHLEIDWMLTKTEEDLSKRVVLEKSWISLDIKGDLMDSDLFGKALMKEFEQQNSRLVFLIGGADGIAPELLQKSHRKWSLSPLTFTHQITRLILAEQLYRALSIAQGSKYHK